MSNLPDETNQITSMANQGAFAYFDDFSGGQRGLTKHEYFSALAMQAAIMRNDKKSESEIASFAASCADALIFELENYPCD